jgi:small subunit ribosomal protein S2
VTDAIIEARREAPVREEVEEGQSYTYSSDRGAEPQDRDRNRRGQGGGGERGGDRPRRRRAKPDAIAARLKGDTPEAADKPAETPDQPSA